MLEICGERARVAFWVLGLMALLVTLFAFCQVNFGQRKSDANAIISPWDFTQAPPQSVKKTAVRVIVPGKTDSTSNRSVEVRHYRPYVQASVAR
ncbi:MAG: hypothetical protein ACYC64_11175 [Armatimonadota bacterium]